jgi:hypothetical protein
MGYLGYKPADKPLTSADITDGIITSAKIVDGTIVNADINASAAIVSTKLSGVTIDIKAFVRFNGTTNFSGFCSIDSTRNVSSVTDNGTGDYTINFTTAMSNTNYCANVNAQGSDGDDNGMFVYLQTYNTGSFRCGTRTNRNTDKADSPKMNVVIFNQ